jgi:Carbohydrate-selective porin
LRRPGRSRPGFASRAWGAEFASTVLIDQDLRAFTQAAVAQGTDLAAPDYVEAGLRLQGPTWLRPQDELTVAAARAWLRAAPGLSLQPESVLELLYSLAVLPNVYLQPDLQWVHHPLLVGRARGDALVSFLRLYVNFE